MCLFRKLSGPNLVIVPLAVAQNWMNEIKKWLVDMFGLHVERTRYGEMKLTWSVFLTLLLTLILFLFLLRQDTKFNIR